MTQPTADERAARLHVGYVGERSRNQCGTDTHAIGHMCPCATCQRWRVAVATIAAEIRAAEAVARAEGRREGLEEAAAKADEWSNTPAGEHIATALRAAHESGRRETGRAGDALEAARDAGASEMRERIAAKVDKREADGEYPLQSDDIRALPLRGVR